MNTKINYKRILGAIILSLPFLTIWWISVFLMGPILATIPFVISFLGVGSIVFGNILIAES